MDYYEVVYENTIFTSNVKKKIWVIKNNNILQNNSSLNREHIDIHIYSSDTCFAINVRKEINARWLHGDYESEKFNELNRKVELKYIYLLVTSSTSTAQFS